MGWSYRKSISAGPFRVSLSKSGIGYSVGAKGVRTGVTSTGRKYTTFSVPGTGLSYSTRGGLPGVSGKGRKVGCLVMVAALPAVGLLIGEVL